MNTNWYSIFNPTTGELVGTMLVSDEEVETNTPSGHEALLGEYSPSAGYILGGSYQPYTEAQATLKASRSASEGWDNVGMVKIDFRNLSQAKSEAWNALKTEREIRMKGTFTHAGHTFDIDPVNLSGASIDAREAIIAGEPWTQMWVLADNSVITLTAAEMIALARAAKTVVSNLWATSQYLRGLIEAATTIPEVEAITWP